MLFRLGVPLRRALCAYRQVARGRCSVGSRGARNSSTQTQLDIDAHDWFLPTRPVTLLHLHLYAASPSQKALLGATSALQHELPTRLHNLLCDVKRLRLPAEALSVGDVYQITQQELRQVLQSWRLHESDVPPAQTLEHVCQFTEGLQARRDEMEAAVARIGAAVQSRTQDAEWWSFLPRVATMGQLLDLCHHWMVGARLMMAQQQAAWARLAGSQELQAQYPSLVQGGCAVVELLEHTVEDCRAFCVEKNGSAPEVVVEGEPGLRVLTVPPYVKFIAVELLKNAMQALLDRYGAWDVDEAAPVVVRVGTCPEDDHYFQVSVHDTGGGVPKAMLGRMMLYYGTSVTKTDTGYGYSRDHGSKFKGFGVGVPMTRLYAHFMGGEVGWRVDWEAGTTTVKLMLPKAGFVL